MNLAVHGLSGDIRQGNTYYEDLHGSTEGGRAGKFDFVMANSAADARGTELEIRKKLIQSCAVDVMVSVGPNFFYTVTLPCTLWLFDRGKSRQLPHPGPLPLGEVGRRPGEGVRGSDTILFLDARHIYRQLDRAHRDFTPEQIEFLANIVRLYRGEEIELDHGSEAQMKEQDDDDFDFTEPLGELNDDSFVLLRTLKEKNRVLRQARDLLLPKLISGELDVGDLDINVGDAAA